MALHISCEGCSLYHLLTSFGCWPEMVSTAASDCMPSFPLSGGQVGIGSHQASDAGNGLDGLGAQVQVLPCAGSPLCVVIGSCNGLAQTGGLEDAPVTEGGIAAAWM